MSIISEMGPLLVFLLLISSLVRSFQISSSPPELFGDELDVGYQAYSLLQTGRDIYSSPLPIYIRSLSEARAPLLIYATVPSIGLLGLTDLGVRAPEIIFGSLAPLLLFGLAYRTSRSKWVSFFSALVVSLSPWHIMYSRSAFEVVIMLDLIMVGTLLFLNNKKVLSVFSFALSMYTYSTAIVFTPLLMMILFSTKLKIKPLVLPSFVFLLLLGPLVSKIITGEGSNRFAKVSIFSDQTIVKSINEQRSADHTNLASIWFNQPLAYLKVFTNNYFQAFSPEFLFIRGDPTMRHSLQYIGQLYSLWLPLMLIGIYFLSRRRQWLWLFWLLLAPIPSALTSDGAYHATRLFLLLPPLCIAIGTGLAFLFRSNRLIFSGYLLLMLLQIIFVGRYYFIQYPKDSWRWWHLGYKTTLTELARLDTNYSRIFINNTYEPSLIRFLFYTKYSPVKFHKEFTLDQPKASIVSGYDGFTLDNRFFFGNFSKDLLLMPNSLYLISQRDNVAGDWDWRSSSPDNIQVLHTSVDPQNKPILYLITKK